MTRSLLVLGHALRWIGFLLVLLTAPGLFVYDCGDRLLDAARRRAKP